MNDCLQYFRDTNWSIVVGNEIIFFENRLDWFISDMQNRFPVIKYNCKPPYRAIMGNQITATLFE